MCDAGGDIRHRDRGLTMKHRGGFTFVEILAAMLLMAIALPAIMQAATIAVAGAHHARHLNEAASLAESKLSEIAIEQSAMDTATSGDFAPDHPEYRFAIESVARDFGMTEIIVHV